MEQKKTYIEYRCDECDKIIPYGSEIAVKAKNWSPMELFCSESCFVKYAKRKAMLEKVKWEYEQEYRYIASPENGFLSSLSVSMTDNRILETLNTSYLMNAGSNLILTIKG